MGKPSDDRRLDLLQGTLDMLILRTLQWGPQHGHGIGQAIRAQSDDLLRVETGSLYPALHRLEKRGWLKSEWGVSEANQRAKYYRLTAAGKAQLVARARPLDPAGRGDRPDHEPGADRGVTPTMRPDERDLDDEIRGHLALSIKERIERGEDPEAARLAALREFGYVPAARDDDAAGVAQPVVRRADRPAAGHARRPALALARQGPRRSPWWSRWPSASAPTPRSSASCAACCCARWSIATRTG